MSRIYGTSIAPPSTIHAQHQLRLAVLPLYRKSSEILDDLQAYLRAMEQGPRRSTLQPTDTRHVAETSGSESSMRISGPCRATIPAKGV